MNQTPISFTISFKEPQAHYMEVEMSIKNISDEFIDLKMPVWTPGSYLVREYSKNIESFTVVSNPENETVEFKKISKNTWRVFHFGKNITVNYRVYGFEQSVRTNFIDDSHAFISPAATFLYINGRKELSSHIHIQLPNQWSAISTGLPKLDEKSHTYVAENIDILIDSPIEVGNQDVWKFEVENTVHEFAMVGGGNYDKDKITKDVSKIIQEANSIWGTNPNQYYLFVTHNYQSAYGGLEHLNSTILAFSRNNYTNPEAYKNYLGLVAHEYFHLWCVKRLRPLELGPFNYDEENYTSALWVMEGFTSYYDNLITRRAGIRDENNYLKTLAIDFNAVYSRPGHTIQSASMASFDTWIKHYRPDENSQNSSISYYNKGAMLACALDIKIISGSHGKIRLDHVLREAYRYFYVERNRGFELSEFKEFAESLTKIDISDIFEAADSCQELDYNHLFNQVGYALVNQNKDSQKLSLGIKTGLVDQRLIIKSVERNSGAWHSGLNVNDEIIAVNNHRIDPQGKELESWIQHSKEGEALDILISRDGIIRNLQTPIQPDIVPDYAIVRLEDRSELQTKLGNIWLSL